MKESKLGKTDKSVNWPKRRWRTLLVVLLVVIIILGGVIYNFRRAILEVLSNSHEVGGNPAIANLHLPPGFQVNVFFSGLNAPRFITFGPDRTLFVAERGAGSIIALPDPGHTGKAASKKLVISGLNDPTSLVFYQGALYVGEQTQVGRFTLRPNYQVTSRKVIVPNLPADGQHTTRTVLIGPDGKLYVSIGSSCNVCSASNRNPIAQPSGSIT